MTIFKNFNIPTIIKSIQLMGKKSKLYLTCIFLFCVIEIVCNVLYTFGIKGIITSLSDINYSLFWKSLLFITINHILWWTYAPISTYVCAIASKGTVRDFKTNLCEHIIRLPMKIHDTKSKGELLSVVSNDTACLQTIYDWSFFQVLRSLLGGLGGIVIMAIIDWRFAIIVFSLGTLSVITSSHFSRKLEKIGEERQKQLSQTSTDAYELMKAGKTIRLLHLQDCKTKKICSSTKLEAVTKIKCGIVSSKMNSIIIGINSLSYLAIIFIGALFVYYNLSNWGTVVALMGLKNSTDMLFSECGQHMAGMQANIAGVKRLLQIVNMPEETIINEQTFTTQKSNTALVLNKVHFMYNETTPILNGFSMALENNQLTALVGESGCGKSTIMKLILGLYEPTKGMIIFGENQENSNQNLRNKTAYVPQDSMLFRASIYDNISCLNPKVTMDDVISASKLAGADEFICSLEYGYNTVLLDYGKSLSGGQQQRIAIARALVKNAPILLLDEITSALDKQTEDHIMETIKNISKTKSVLFITHKKDFSMWADKIYTL